jgi:hypothetical protein
MKSKMKDRLLVPVFGGGFLLGVAILFGPIVAGVLFAAAVLAVFVVSVIEGARQNTK